MGYGWDYEGWGREGKGREREGKGRKIGGSGWADGGGGGGGMVSRGRGGGGGGDWKGGIEGVDGEGKWLRRFFSFLFSSSLVSPPLIPHNLHVRKILLPFFLPSFLPSFQTAS